jgi:hypothetical protein
MQVNPANKKALFSLGGFDVLLRLLDVRLCGARALT